MRHQLRDEQSKQQRISQLPPSQQIYGVGTKDSEHVRNSPFLLPFMYNLAQVLPLLYLAHDFTDADVAITGE